jgi:Tfp pilus assembly protein PilF
MARIIVALVVLACLGCQTWRERYRARYETVQANPHRNTDAARRETQRAAYLIQQNMIDLAEQSLQHALVADVSYGPAHCNLGHIYARQGKYYLASWEFEYASRLMPDAPEPLNNLGIVFEEVGRMDEAMDYYQSAVDLAPTNPEFLGNLVRVKIRSGEKDDHVRHLLRELLLYETRPQWRAWAEEQYELSDWDGDDSDVKTEVDKSETRAEADQPSFTDLTSPEELDETLPEILPAPIPSGAVD